MQTILIVDEQPVEFDLLRTLPEDDDYHFETATSGAGVRALVEDRGPEIAAILMDWFLPDDVKYTQPGNRMAVRLPLEGQGS